MENMAEQSSSVSVTSSSVLSVGSPGNKAYAYDAPENNGLMNPEIVGLNKLSCNLEQLLSGNSRDYSDAVVALEDGSVVGVHRCILAARCKYFDDIFSTDKGSAVRDDGKGKPKYFMKDLLPYGKIGHEAFIVFLSYLYTGKLKPPPLEASTCVDSPCNHDSCRAAIDFALELMYASTIFQVPELVSLFQRRLLNMVGKAVVEDVIPILQVACNCELGQLLTQCIHRVAQSNLETISIDKELPAKVAEDIRLLRLKSQAEHEDQVAQLDPLHESRVKRIHKALDSDDIELVRLLLTESDITLDEAYALHYAVAYSDPKIVSEVLSLSFADVNLRNTRGNTVLHVAARRNEPSIIVSLLTKGACASELTPEGQNAVRICRRMTRPKDYQMKREQGQEANRSWLCIDVLEREMHRNPTAWNASISTLATADDLQMKLRYLDARVSFAQRLFPTEAKLALEIAHAEITSDLDGLLSSNGPGGNLMEVDLDETLLTLNEKLVSRLKTLSRTVELGRIYFPNCSQVLDKFLDELPDAFYLEKGTPEEQRMKRKRFMELRDEVHKAFSKDKAELCSTGVSSSSSLPSLKANYKARKVRQ